MNQNGKRRVVVMRERNGRTLPFVVRAEDEAVATIPHRVVPSSVVHADDAKHWNTMHVRFETRRINHTLAYSTDGANTN